MTEDERLARACIEKTLAACAMAGDVRRADAYADCFTVKAVLELDTPIEGREAIRGWMAAPSAIPAPPEGVPGFVSHHLTSCRITLDSATTALVRTCWLVITAHGLDHSGYYDDRFRKVGDAWLIEHRRPRTLWISPNSLLADSGRD